MVDIEVKRSELNTLEWDISNPVRSINPEINNKHWSLYPPVLSFQRRDNNPWIKQILIAVSFVARRIKLNPFVYTAVVK